MGLIPGKCKIVIIEPSPVVRQGLRVLIDEQPEFAVWNLYCDLQSFQENHAGFVPDVILINPGVIDFHKQFSIRTLFTDYFKSLFVAILYKYVNHQTLTDFNGVLDIYDDEQTMIGKLHEIIKTNQGRENRDNDNNRDLSEREKEILTSVAQGLTNKEIADQYHISVHTVVSHRKNITRKIGVKTVSGLTVYAILNNLISQEDLIL